MLRALSIGCFLVLSASPGLFGDTVLVREGDVWYFFRGRYEPPVEWTLPEFNPRAEDWESGPTGIGYGDADDATILDDMQNSYLTVYARIDIDVPAGVQGYTWVFRVRYDDGFVAYIDGVEVARRLVTGYPPPFSQPTDGDHEITSPVGFDEEIVLEGAGAFLSPGTHVLAVQVHNSTYESSDLSFSAELVGFPFRLVAIRPASGPVEGGNEVAIEGEGFEAADVPEVRFGGVLSPSVRVVSVVELRAVVPPAVVPGTVEVAVTDSRGSATVPGGYRYVEPGQFCLAFTRQSLAQASRYGDLYREGTFELWIRRELDFQRDRAVLSVAAAAGGDALRIIVRGGNLRAASEGTGTLVSGATISAQEWHHVAFSFSPSGRKLYLDGQLVGADTVAIELPEATALRLGSSFGGTGSFTGRIESVRVWKVERSAEKIRRYRYAKLSDEPGLESYWPLEEGAGQTAGNRGPSGTELVLGTGTGADGADPAWEALEDFPAVAVSAVEPSAGPLSGGGTVRIYGVGFREDPPPAVRFGSRAALAVSWKSAWEIEAQVPRGDAYGPVDVAVAVGGTEVVAPGGYSYEPSNVETPVREGDLWHYFVATAPPPADWADPGFDPEAYGWPSGPTGIGYGDDDDATDVAYMLNTAAAVYARIEWNLLADPSDVVSLRLRIRYDDGYVAYLNGGEVSRRNVAGYPPGYDELASDLHEITVGAGGFDEEVDIASWKSFLHPGVNVLAIEVHNQAFDSSDLSLSAELVVGWEGGGVQTLFIRGDTDADGRLSITDAIRIIRYLFWGDIELTCLEAADSDDDGRINITDPISLLDFLFREGPQPPPPYPDPGPDADDDPFDCQG